MALSNWTRELYWRIRPAASPAPPTWQPDPALLKVCRLEWPARYAWKPAAKWAEHVRIGLAGWVPVRRTAIEQDYAGIVMARLIVGGQAFEIAFDYSDYPVLNEACALRASVYFKMQCPSDGFPAWPNVHPGGFVPASSMIYRALPVLRGRRDRCDFRFDVYGRFGLDFGRDIRSKALTLLSAQSSFRFAGGPGRVRYSQYLHEIAHSKVCIDLPGRGDLCFRLIDYLAVGACIVAVRPRDTLHVPLEDGIQVAYVGPDLDELLSTCQHYIEHDAERERLCRNSREFFDRFLHRHQLAAYYLHKAFQCILTDASP